MRLMLTPKWLDPDDGMLEVRISLSGQERAAWVEMYAYPENFEEFGRKLIEFPRSISDEVVLALGSSAKEESDQFALRAYVYDGAGHSAIEFNAITNEEPLPRATFKFSVPIEAASLNRLGESLVAWSASSDRVFTFE
jgi:hypothetical protein